MIEMITRKKAVGSPSSEWYGLSTDTKPTDAFNADPFLEMDTGKVFLFDAENKVWIEQ